MKDPTSDIPINTLSSFFPHNPERLRSAQVLRRIPDWSVPIAQQQTEEIQEFTLHSVFSSYLVDGAVLASVMP